MPTSYIDNIPNIVRIIQDHNPSSVLDIGPGWGKYGLLTREYVPDLIKIDACEVWEGYVTPLLKAIYDRVQVGDVRDLLPIMGYDLVLMIDVIEHFTKPDGHQILDNIQCPVLISTPKEEYYAEYDNPYENHRSHWTSDDFAPYSYLLYPNSLSTIVLITP